MKIHNIKLRHQELLWIFVGLRMNEEFSRDVMKDQPEIAVQIRELCDRVEAILKK